MMKKNHKLVEIDVETIATRKHERMSTQQRSEYLSEKIREYVHEHPEGVSTTIIAEKYGIQPLIARNHLEALSKLREIYSINVNRSTKMYFPNGKLIHPYLQSKREFGDKSFKLSINQVGEKEVLHIQELKYSLLTGEKPEGGLLIDIKNIDDLMEEINKLLNKLEEIKHGK